jgi:hypothetical protein
LKVQIRKPLEGDIGFIFSTWLKSYRHDSPLTWPIRQDVFFDQHEQLVKRLFQRPNVMIAVSCDESDPALIFGYLVIEKPNTVHFCYVKKSLRRYGIMAKLLEEFDIPKDLEGWAYSHLTNSTQTLWKEGKWKGVFNPYLAYGENSEGNQRDDRAGDQSGGLRSGSGGPEMRPPGAVVRART